jgi:hypothetical protein
LKIQG